MPKYTLKENVLEVHVAGHHFVAGEAYELDEATAARIGDLVPATARKSKAGEA